MRTPGDQPRPAAPAGPLHALNQEIHAELDEHLLRCLENLTALDLAAARRDWDDFTALLREHSSAEDAAALPPYGRLGEPPRGGSPEIVEGEHRTLSQLVGACASLLRSFPDGGHDLRRKVVLALPRFYRLQGLLEHHTLREQQLMYPLLDERLAHHEREFLERQLRQAWPRGKVRR